MHGRTPMRMAPSCQCFVVISPYQKVPTLCVTPDLRPDTFPTRPVPSSLYPVPDWLSRRGTLVRHLSAYWADCFKVSLIARCFGSL